VLRVSNAALRWVPPGTPRSPASGGEGAASPRGEARGEDGETAAAQRNPAQLLETLTRELTLTPKQVSEAQALATAMREAITKAGEDPAARREAARKQRADFARKLEAMLTPEQQEKYRAFRASQPQGGAGRNAAQSAAQGVPARVFVLDEAGKPRALTLRIGATDGTLSEVLSGEIKPGDGVITGSSGSGKQARQSSAFRFGL
jgi:HlyD family secretion protein